MMNVQSVMRAIKMQGVIYLHRKMAWSRSYRISTPQQLHSRPFSYFDWFSSDWQVACPAIKLGPNGELRHFIPDEVSCSVFWANNKLGAAEGRGAPAENRTRAPPRPELGASVRPPDPHLLYRSRSPIPQATGLYQLHHTSPKQVLHPCKEKATLLFCAPPHRFLEPLIQNTKKPGTCRVKTPRMPWPFGLWSHDHVSPRLIHLVLLRTIILLLLLFCWGHEGWGRGNTCRH